MKIDYAYELDEVLYPFENGSYNPRDFKDDKICWLLKLIEKCVQPVAPKQQCFDLKRVFWFPFPVGEFNTYVAEIAGDVEEELKWQWEGDYPESLKWYRVVCIGHSKQEEFRLLMNEYFVMMTDNADLRGSSHSFEEQYMLLAFILEKLTKLVDQIEDNPIEYNQYLEKNLSKRNRFARIKRSDFWKHYDECCRVDLELGVENVEKFVAIVPDLMRESKLEKMTAHDFFRFCEIGYDANDYQLDKELSAREKYQEMADMRDDGLTQIEGKSTEAFEDWYHNGRECGHPFEICRGGNSTHISLFVHHEKGEGWSISLEGSSSARVVETVKMAIALYEHNVPFYLYQADEIKRMITGEDFIGIVPKGAPTRYMGDCFPKEDRIIDFIDPWYDPEDFEKVQDDVYWYPLESYQLVKGMVVTPGGKLQE